MRSAFRDSESDFSPRYGWKNSILREMIRAVAILPFAIKLLVVVFLVADFVIITQWEKLPFGHTARPVAPKKAVPPPTQSKQADAKPVKAAATDKFFASAVEQYVIKHMEPVTLVDPRVQSDGSIHNDGQRLYLYGIKPFDSKKVCTRASGERWACGLEAYATLHNEVAHKTVVCKPKEIRADSIGATCRMDGADIALALVRSGLVELDDKATDVEMRNAQEFAKSHKLGIWNR